jgi:hypothetical protein|tara:strand:+ start:1892 stop:2116 length:225 start_codon:yes stop_codon:yes gene_type:complete
MVIGRVGDGHPVSADRLSHFRQKGVTYLTCGFFQRETVLDSISSDIAFFYGRWDSHFMSQISHILGIGLRLRAT